LAPGAVVQSRGSGPFAKEQDRFEVVKRQDEEGQTEDECNGRRSRQRTAQNANALRSASGLTAPPPTASDNSDQIGHAWDYTCPPEGKETGLTLAVGLSHEITVPITPELTAKHLALGDSAVFSTPSMVWLVEHAAQLLAQMHLPPGQTTVGLEVFVRHLAPTPLGMNVTARVTIAAIEGRRVTFTAEVFDRKEKVGEGRHVRVIVEHARFMEKAKGKTT
jgi:fluoroacetyl-CoA thioesterase